jgi:hypothetical protein
MSAAASTAEHVVAAPQTGSAAGRSLSWWLWAGTVGAGAAGALHIAVAAEHLEAGDLAVGFFLLAALAQIGTASWLILHALTGQRPDHRFVTLALGATVALVGLYVVAHTTSLLDAFAVHGGSDHSGGAHAGSNHTPGIDPVTGVDYSQGVAIRPAGPVAMAGEVAPARHAPGMLGPVTVGAELLLIAAMTALQPATWRGRTVNGLLALGVLTWGLWLTGVLA